MVRLDQRRRSSARRVVMSEYQYYEFQAIDRLLTAKEMAKLRSYSTRARITPTSFVNDYSWGNFKGDEDAWMERYFDAFLYLASWGTHVLKLRLPGGLLEAETARQYCPGEQTSVREKNGNVILTFVSEDEGGDWIEGAGQLSSLMLVRAELGRGDLRALYLGWLLHLQRGDLDDDDVEPPVPNGLTELSTALESFTEFLQVDSDLVCVAAAASPPLVDCETKSDDVRAWLAKLAIDEKDDFLARMIAGDAALASELIQRMRRERVDASPDRARSRRRTVGELLRAAEHATDERRRIEAETAAKEERRRARKAAATRRKHLDKLAGTEPLLWKRVEELIATMKPRRYDDAVAVLADIRDLADRTDGANFRRRLEALRAEHVRKRSLIDRLHKASL